MKRYFIFLLFAFFTFSTYAQVKVDVKKKVNRQANQRANSKTDQAIDKTFDKLEEGIGSLFGKKKKKEKGQAEQTNETQPAQEQKSTVVNDENSLSTGNTAAHQPNVKWAKYDFVPGDEVIFEDGPSMDEENGEFPSRWDLYKGAAEIGEVNGENVIMFLNGGGEIVPYLKNAEKDYLPDVFTVEFDVWFDKGKTTSNRYFISFKDIKHQKNNGLNDRLTVYPNGLEFLETDKRYPGTEGRGWSDEPTGKWRHISIAYTSGKFKAYMDDTRLINVPHLEGNPWGLTINSLKDKMYLKNIRIAKGGVKYYDRVLSDGKIIVNGIRFDVNKATIKPESYGAINEIFSLMEKQPELNFSVEGHTDSDGDDKLNQKLSEARAKAVMDYLVGMGISSNRLKSTGWGESKPLADNGTAEGKANNRRVEFVKFEGSSSSTSNSGGNSEFDKLNNNNITEKLDNLPNESIQISNFNGIVNGPGTVIVYATSDGNLGKMEILDVDKNDNYKLTVKYVTYNSDGSVHSQSNHLDIKGTYNCDLDKGNAEDMIQSDVDFNLGRQDDKTTTIYPGEISTLRVLPN